MQSKSARFALKGQEKMQEGTQNMVFDDSDVEIVDLDPREYKRHHHPVWKRFTKRQRRVGTIVTAVVYLLTLGLLVSTLPGIGTQIWHHLFPVQRAGTPHTVPFYLAGNPSWGHFAIDGKPVETLPVVGQGRPLALAPGTYTLDWQAAPFQAQHCLLQLTSTRMLATGSSCTIRSTPSPGTPTRTLVVCFFASLNDLPPAQQAHVLQQTQAALAEQTQQTIVQPGEWYALSPQEPGVSQAACRSTTVGTLCATRATRPLQAVLHLQVQNANRSGGQCNPLLLCQLAHQDCRSFCENQNMPLQAQGWNIQTLAHGYWTYTPLTAQLAWQTQPLSFVSTTTSQSISLYLTWDQHRWQVTLLDAPGMVDSPQRNPICLQAQQDLQRISGLSNQRAGLIQIIGDSASAPADGCLVALQPASTSPSGNAHPASAYCFERFGVLLAVNTLARHLWPYLPVINAQEQRLVDSFEPSALDGLSGLG